MNHEVRAVDLDVETTTNDTPVLRRRGRLVPAPAAMVLGATQVDAAKGPLTDSANLTLPDDLDDVLELGCTWGSSHRRIDTMDTAVSVGALAFANTRTA